ncbi:MAG: gliding motility-associated C-terminal domain-containing protein [Lewinellaceae bacterium]|nr:gliding motility-associated C-terminal domain-containing protein [Lewinellaceae bacterium]
MNGNPVNPAAVGAGTYIAIATDLAGLCTDTDTATVTLQDSIDISSQVSVQEICNSTTINFENTSGQSGTWNFGDNTTSNQNTGSHTYAGFGTFSVTFVADEDCVLPVTLEANPSADDFAVTAPDVTGCEPAATLAATTNLPGNIVWTDLNGNPVNPAAVGAGTYIAIATDLAGLCTDTDTATVTLQDSIDISSQVSVQEICNSTTINFENTSGQSGTWNFGDNTTSNQNSGSHTYAGFGTFTVTFVADEDCVLPVTLEANPSADDFAVTAPDVTGCEPAATLAATTNLPGNIVWTDLNGNPVDPAAVGAGTYIAIATDLAGLCTDTDTATVTLQDSIDISSQVSVQEICNSTTINFENTSGQSGIWNFGDNTTSNQNSGSHTYAGFGTFTVTFVADEDCVLPVTLEANPSADDFAVTAPDVTGCEPAATLAATTSLPGNIVWTDLNGNPVDPAAVGAGTYIAIATDLAGLCTDTDTATVTLQDSIDISSQVSVQEICNSTTINFENTSGQNGIWNFGDNTTSNQNSGSHTYAGFGTFTVTFVADEDCVLPVTLEANPSADDFAVTAPDVTGCEPAATLAATTNLPGNIVWTDLNGNPVDPAAVGAGTYIAIATDLAGLCTDTDTATVTLQDSIDVSNAVSVIVRCNSLQVTFINTSGLAGTWNFGDGVTLNTQEDTVLHTYAGYANYAVHFIPDGDCVLPFSESLPLSPSFFDVDAPDVLTCDTVATLSATTPFPAVVTWTNLFGNPVDPAAVGAGTYIATAVDPTQFCIATDTAIITLVDSIDISAQITIAQACNGTTVIFENLSGFVGTWDFGDGSSTSTLDSVAHTYPQPGVYPVTFVSDEFCVQPLATVVTVVPDIFSVTAPDVLVCEPEAALSATTSLPGTVLWTDLAGNPIDPASVGAGVYIATATDISGVCTAVDTVTVTTIIVDVTAEVTGKDTVCLNESTTLLAVPVGNAIVYTYSWSPAETLEGADTPTPVATPNGPQTYTVTVTGDGFCTATASVEVFFMETQCRAPYIFVPNAFTPNGDGNNDLFRVRGTDITELYFIVYDRWGEEMYRTEDPQHTGWDGTFRGRAVTPDSYGWYLRVRCGNEQYFENKGNVTLLK